MQQKGKGHVVFTFIVFGCCVVFVLCLLSPSALIFFPLSRVSCRLVISRLFIFRFEQPVLCCHYCLRGGILECATTSQSIDRSINWSITQVVSRPAAAAAQPVLEHVLYCHTTVGIFDLF